MADKIVTLSAEAGPPEIEIIIGQIQRGDFEILLFPKDGGNSAVIGRGQNEQAHSFKFVLDEPVDELDARLLFWDVIIGASSSGSQNWSVTLTIRQDGEVVDNGTIIDRGEFETVTRMTNRVRFNVK